jgi:hypothetical protein
VVCGRVAAPSLPPSARAGGDDVHAHLATAAGGDVEAGATVGAGEAGFHGAGRCRNPPRRLSFLNRKVRVGQACRDARVGSGGVRAWQRPNGGSTGIVDGQWVHTGSRTAWLPVALSLKLHPASFPSTRRMKPRPESLGVQASSGRQAPDAGAGWGCLSEAMKASVRALFPTRGLPERLVTGRIFVDWSNTQPLWRAYQTMTDAPDFLDPALQDESPEQEILALLRTLTAQYSPVWPDSHPEEMALGVLQIAGGAEIKESGLGAASTRRIAAASGPRAVDGQRATLEGLPHPAVPHRRSHQGNGVCAVVCLDRVPGPPGRRCGGTDS